MYEVKSLGGNGGTPHGAKRAWNKKHQAEFAPSDSPWERPCFNSGTLPCTYIRIKHLLKFCCWSFFWEGEEDYHESSRSSRFRGRGCRCRLADRIPRCTGARTVHRSSGGQGGWHQRHPGGWTRHWSRGNGARTGGTAPGHRDIGDSGGASGRHRACCCTGGGKWAEIFGGWSKSWSVEGILADVHRRESRGRRGNKSGRQSVLHAAVVPVQILIIAIISKIVVRISTLWSWIAGPWDGSFGGAGGVLIGRVGDLVILVGGIGRIRGVAAVAWCAAVFLRHCFHALRREQAEILAWHKRMPETASHKRNFSLSSNFEWNLKKFPSLKHPRE